MFYEAKGASNDPCDPTYCGQYPESEPEAEAVAKFLRSHKDTVKLYISIHSYSQMLLFPYSCSYDEAPNHNELVRVMNNSMCKLCVFNISISIFLCLVNSLNWLRKPRQKYADTTGIIINMVPEQKPSVSFSDFLPECKCPDFLLTPLPSKQPGIKLRCIIVWS